MYLNLDLLYNVDNYLFPLFYYNGCNYNYKSSNKVYSPITKKCIFNSVYYDFITKKMQNGYFIFDFDDTKHIITENTITWINTITWKNIIYNKCNPFKLNSEDLYFLKNNTRIN